MTQLLDLRNATNLEETSNRVRQALRDGMIVALPTETVYGLAASSEIPDAVARLHECKGRPESKPLALAVASPAAAMEWAPQMGRMGRRLAWRCWPGPLTLVCPVDPDSPARVRLGEPVYQRVCPSGTIGLRVPNHKLILRVLREMTTALVLTSANPSGRPPATSAEELLQAEGLDVDLVIDAGPCEYARPSTVVAIEGDRWRILREGVYSTEDLDRLSATIVLFVCTGNTCRSPMAEAICKKLLAQRLGCRVEELPRRGFLVHSCGLAAVAGMPATEEAQLAAAELGADLSTHRSQPFQPDLAGRADFVIGMTIDHLLILQEEWDNPLARPRLLSRDQVDLPDPIGGELQDYRETARRIQQEVEALLPELIG